MVASSAEPGIFGHGRPVGHERRCGCRWTSSHVRVWISLHEVEFDLRAHPKAHVESHFWLEMGISSQSENNPPPEVGLLAMLSTPGAVGADVGDKSGVR